MNNFLKVRRYLFYCLGFWFATLWGCIAQSPIEINFSRENSLKEVKTSGSTSYLKEKQALLLRGTGSVFLKEPRGAGVYRVRFSLSKPEGFAYFRNLVRLFVPNPQFPDKEGYSIQWDLSGLFTLTPGQRFISPGRENPFRFEEGEIMELLIYVPDEADSLILYKGPHEPPQPPRRISAFKLEGTHSEGYFGVYNPKGYSEVLVYEITYFPK